MRDSLNELHGEPLDAPVQSSSLRFKVQAPRPPHLRVKRNYQTNPFSTFVPFVSFCSNSKNYQTKPFTPTLALFIHIRARSSRSSFYQTKPCVRPASSAARENYETNPTGIRVHWCAFVVYRKITKRTHLPRPSPVRRAREKQSGRSSLRFYQTKPFAQRAVQG